MLSKNIVVTKLTTNLLNLLFIITLINVNFVLVNFNMCSCDWYFPCVIELEIKLNMNFTFEVTI